MKQSRLVLGWIGVGVLAALVIGWAFPRAYPLYPDSWQISKPEAELIGLERLRDLGDLPERPYVVTRHDEAGVLEHRLQGALQSLGREAVVESFLAQSLVTWEITVWAPGARAQEWSFHGRVTPSGEVTELLRRIPPEQGGGTQSAEEAHTAAVEFLEDQGFDFSIRHLGGGLHFYQSR